MKIPVTGVTGFVDQHLVPLLPDTGHDVVVSVRDVAYYDGPPDVEVVESDIFEPVMLDPVMVGVGAAYYLIHSMHAGGDFETCDRLAARNFMDATGSVSAERSVYLGDFSEDRDQLSMYLRSRREVEHVPASGVPAFTTFRTAIIAGMGSASFETVRQLAIRLPVMVTSQWVETRCQPTTIANVVAYPAGVLDHSETAGETYEIGGPDAPTYREMPQRVSAQLGHAPRIVPVSVLTSRFSSYWVGLVTDVDTGITHPLIEGLKNPVIVGDDRVRDIVAVGETPFDAAVERALRKERKRREKTVEPASTTPT